MINQYRLQDPNNSNRVVQYQYGDDGIDYRSRLIEQSDDGSKFLRTEYDVIKSWADFARDALEGDYPDFQSSGLACWAGHYDQFGMVMMNLANMSRYRTDCHGDWNQFLENSISKYCFQYILQGADGSEDRMYYRSWFTMIGHPDFLKPIVLDIEIIQYKSIELALCLSVTCLKSHLRSLNK